MRFITAGLLILLVFAAWFSIVHAHQDGDEGAEGTTFSKGKEVFNKGTATIATIRGRKMLPDVEVKMPEKLPESSAAIERTSISTSATHKLSGKCQGKEKTNANHCKKSGSRHVSEDDKGFVAFTADYHSPRHHPPKNN